MKSICRDIFRAVHEGKWLSIEYHNKEGQNTKYWIGIQDMDAVKRTLKVEGLHLGQYTMNRFDCIYIDSITASHVVEGSYCPVNQELVEDIYLHPQKYNTLFDNTANLKILSYLEMCNRMDAVPYYSDFELVRYLDRESFDGEAYELNEEQFRMIVKSFQYKTGEAEKKSGKVKLQQLGMNVLSIHTPKGLYLLAYRKLMLDVKRKVLQPAEEISICTEYTLNGTKQSVRSFLDAEEYDLLKDFEENQEKIKDCVTRHNGQALGVDDMPYIVGLGIDIILDLHKEYKAIIEMYHENTVTVPIRAFFGDLLKRPDRRKEYPIALIDRKVNLDQLLAVHNALKYPTAYIQGPPGTGKTNTIMNTIITAFFNEKTVLFVSYNNHPINSVFKKLSTMNYMEKVIPFPILRLGNTEKMKEALPYMRRLYEQAKETPVFEATLDRNKDDRIERARKLSNLLKKYEDVLDLKEREETLNRLLEHEKQYGQSFQMLPFQADLSGRQLRRVSGKLAQAGEITDAEAMSYLDQNTEELKKYLYYTSARYMKRIDDPKNEDLKNILLCEDRKVQFDQFHQYLGKKENIEKLLKIFPVIATTCISAHKLGEPEPMFDMVVMDEASQCNTAIALVPIIRGESLMLVGDPQQLNPVILLDEVINEQLKKRYRVSDDYDYRRNSIYKTYLACDAVSDEILLHNHYRCHEKIIGFNNKKYYNSKLCVKTKSDEKFPLLYVDVQDSQSDVKNTAPSEIAEIVKYASMFQNKSIGVITPFVNQKNMIEDVIEKKHLLNVTCGTVHAFQGDEKDIVLFSTAITDQTYAGTYEWLKNNKELINVATSRAKDKLIVLSSSRNLDRLHQKDGKDDLFELIQYVKTNGQYAVTQQTANSRALGVKPFSMATEEAFLQNLNHALENIWLSQSRFVVEKDVEISHVFPDYTDSDQLFYNGQFDFVVYEQIDQAEIPVIAIELDGKEHFEDEVVIQRDRKKNEICEKHHIQIIRVENSYARRYNHIKNILIQYFRIRH